MQFARARSASKAGRVFAVLACAGTWSWSALAAQAQSSKVLDQAFQDWADQKTIEDRGGRTVFEWLWGSQTPSPLVSFFLVLALSAALGYALMTLIGWFAKGAGAKVAYGARWAAFAAFCAPFAGLQRAAELPLADWLVKGAVAMVMFPAVGFLVGYGAESLMKRNRQSPDARRRYAAALEELEAGTMSKGLWAQCLAQAKGNEAKAKAAYLDARSKELSRPD